MVISSIRSIHMRFCPFWLHFFFLYMRLSMRHHSLIDTLYKLHIQQKATTKNTNNRLALQVIRWMMLLMNIVISSRLNNIDFMT